MTRAPLALPLLAAAALAGCGAGAKRPAAAEVNRLHRELHVVDRVCGRRPTPRELARIATGVDRFLAFAARYPDATFAIDGENARTLSLLLVVRAALRTCDPAAARRVAAALPERYR